MLTRRVQQVRLLLADFCLLRLTEIDPFSAFQHRQLWLSIKPHKSSKRPFQKRGNLVARTVQS
jgi:hypothetical protein